MAHGTDDGRFPGSNGAGHRLFVKAPEVFQRAAATGQDQCIKAFLSAMPRARTICAVASRPLHGSRDQGQFDLRARRRNTLMMSRITAPVGELIMPMRFGWAGRATLPLGCEQAFSAEFFL